MILQKVEVRFEKKEAVRFISHHDLMRAFQRAVRRAGLPIRLTEGYNPKPRIVFPVALEVGAVSLDEVAELELTAWVPLDNLKQRLTETMPPGLNILDVKELNPARKSQVPKSITYRLHLAEWNLQLDPVRLRTLAEAPSLPFQRAARDPRKKQPPKVVDLKPALQKLELDPGGDLWLTLGPGPRGELPRPLEFLSLLLETPLENLRLVRITKTRMETGYA